MVKRNMMPIIQVIALFAIIYVVALFLDYFTFDYIRNIAKLTGSAYVRSLSLNFSMMLSILLVCLVLSFFTNVKFSVLLSSVIIYVVWKWFEYYLFIWLYGLPFCLEFKSEFMFASKYMITIIFGFLVCYLLNNISRKLHNHRITETK